MCSYVTLIESQHLGDIFHLFYKHLQFSCVHFRHNLYSFSICCHNELPQGNWLKTTQICILQFRRSESGTDVTGLTSRCQQDCVAFWWLEGRMDALASSLS